MTTKRMTPEALSEALELHDKWMRGEDGGKRADFSGADLSGAYLYGADLSRANLSRANLSSADLSRANLSRADFSGAAKSWAQVAFMGHGESGRMLTGLRIEDGDETTYFCGCFTGSRPELVEYIERGKDCFKPSRMAALEAVDTLMAIERHD